MSHRARNTLSLAALSLTVGLLAPSAQAASVTYVFDQYTLPPHAAPHVPVAGGSFGTLTLTDSVVDPNRVDISISITPLAAYATGGLDRFYINFETPFRTNHRFHVVDSSTPATGASNAPFTSGQRLGSTLYAGGMTSYNFADFVFDMIINPDSVAQTFEGSLALYNELPSTDEPVNLDVAMFDLTSRGASALQMFAGYRTVSTISSDPGSPNGEFWAFASTTQAATPVPEPGSTALLGIALAGLGVAARRRRAERTAA